MGFSMQRGLVFALHGFLGQGSDWKQVKKECANVQGTSANQLDWITPNLFETESDGILSYDQFCESLIKTYQAQLEKSSHRIFIGYSLGGRLGLHLLKHHAQNFDHFIFVSTHPGLASESEKELRKASDTNLSQQITEGNWDQFLQRWNGQPVLAGEFGNPNRLQKDFNLAALRASLQIWSLGEQQDLRELIQNHQQKITWVVGQKDSKFLNLAEELLQKKILLNVSRIFSGHRVLFENPKELASVLLHQLS